LSLSDINPDPKKLIEQIKLNNGRSLVCKHDRYLHMHDETDIDQLIDTTEIDVFSELNRLFFLDDALYEFQKIHTGDEL